MTMRDALKKGELYSTNVPKSHGAKYPEHKKDFRTCSSGRLLERSTRQISREYMGQSYHLGGGKTGMAEDFLGMILH